MQVIIEHLNNVVRPALRAYIAAERGLDAADESKDVGRIEDARQEAMRAARTAAIELNHFQDVVLHNPSPPDLIFTGQEDIRAALRAACVFAREPLAQVDDPDLLRDTTDAFKHFHLDRKNASVAGAQAVVTIENGFGEMRFGEQKFGGAIQVTIRTKDQNKYALLWLIQNTYDAWMKILKQPELPFWEY